MGLPEFASAQVPLLLLFTFTMDHVDLDYENLAPGDLDVLLNQTFDVNDADVPWLADGEVSDNSDTDSDASTDPPDSDASTGSVTDPEMPKIDWTSPVSPQGPQQSSVYNIVIDPRSNAVWLHRVAVRPHALAFFAPPCTTYSEVRNRTLEELIESAVEAEAVEEVD